MSTEIKALVIMSASIGFFHTLLGPDHYLPFVMLSWARKWSSVKTALVTFLCGLGHIGSSVILGLIGVSVGIAINKLEFVEGFRGNVAAWLLIAFGLAYLAWGLRRVYRSQSHEHSHAHTGATAHAHSHDHQLEHVHVHDSNAGVSIAPWALFIVFVFGPCEPLIPVLMYPAAKNSLYGLVLVTGVFGTATISTMLGVVLLARAGVNFIPITRLQRYSHAIAGATILLCGLAIQFLGL
jgi:nickel/cobalt exporter